MTNNQTAREIINKLRKYGMVAIMDGDTDAMLGYGKSIKEQFQKHSDDRADHLEDEMIYLWEDDFDLVDWTYLTDGNIRSKESVWHLEQMVRDFNWKVIA